VRGGRLAADTAAWAAVVGLGLEEGMRSLSGVVVDAGVGEADGSSL
jgi:hypothetical protein